MSDFEEKLNAILSDPDAMAQVMNLAQSLNLGGPSGEAPQEAEAPPDAGEGPPKPPESAASLSGLGDLLGQVDPGVIQRLLPLLGELGRSEDQDRRLQLLNALRPFLKPERQEKVERAVKAARLLHLGKRFLSAMGEAPHV